MAGRGIDGDGRGVAELGASTIAGDVDQVVRSVRGNDFIRVGGRYCGRNLAGGSAGRCLGQSGDRRTIGRLWGGGGVRRTLGRRSVGRTLGRRGISTGAVEAVPLSQLLFLISGRASPGIIAEVGPCRPISSVVASDIAAVVRNSLGIIRNR